MYLDDATYFEYYSKIYFNGLEQDELFDRITTLLDYNGKKGAVACAVAGFSGMGESNVLFCTNCQLKIKNIEEGDNIMHVHELFSPNCNYVRKFSACFSYNSNNAADDAEVLIRCLVI